MLLHRREDAEVALHPSGIVITNIIINHIGQFFFAGKAFAIVALPFQNAPEAFHRPVVNALGYTGHALLHASLLQFVMKSPVGVLEASIAVEQRVCARIGLHRPVKSLENERIVIAVTDYIGNNAAVIEIQYGTEIDLMYFNAFIPLELCYICEPLLVRLVRKEFPIKKIFGYKLWILRFPGAAMVIILNGGLNVLDAADAQNALVVYMDVLIVSKIVIDAPVSLVRTLHVNLFDLLCYLLVLQGSGTLLTGHPSVVGRS